MSTVTHEKGPALRPTATEPKKIFSLQKRRPLHTIVRGFVQATGLSFLVGFTSSTMTLDVILAVTLWCRS
jgi:hypothetical protein